MGKADIKFRQARESCTRAAFDNALAVRPQIERLREFDDHDAFDSSRQRSDAQFLLIALWRLRIAAERGSKLADSSTQVVTALEVFDQAFPRLRNLRHVLMHYDNYVVENDLRRNTYGGSDTLVNRRDVEAQFDNPDGVAWLGENYAFDHVSSESGSLYRAVAETFDLPGMT